MKFSHFSLFILLFLFHSSCTKDEADEKTSTNVAVDIVGTWTLTEVSCTDGKVKSEGIGEVTNATFSISCKNYAMDLMFKDNPKTFLSQGSYTAITKSSVSGGPTNIQEQAFENFIGTGTWLIVGNKFVINSPGQPEQTAEILKLTSTVLEYKYDLNVVQDFGVFKSTTTGTYVFKCKRK